MPRKQKELSPKKETKEKSPKKSEDPKMDEAAINRLLQNALNEALANARAEQNLEERLTALREEINKKHQEEMIDLQDQFAQSRGANPTTKETQMMQGVMIDAVKAANHSSYFDRKPRANIPKRFSELLVLAEEHKYNPSTRGDAQLKLLFSYLTEMQIGPRVSYCSRLRSRSTTQASTY